MNSEAASRRQAFLNLCEIHGAALAGYPVAELLSEPHTERWTITLLSRWAAGVRQQLVEFPASDSDALRNIKGELARTHAALCELLAALSAEAPTILPPSAQPPPAGHGATTLPVEDA